ncbi:MAG: ubiquinone/menaquinone biosynthesis methyltransferase [Chloroflexia bacterium]
MAHEARLRRRAAAVLPPPDQKAAYVRDMFTDIAPRYDLLNGVMSLGMHHVWRRHAVRLAGLRAGDSALDVATGTGDFALHSPGASAGRARGRRGLQRGDAQTRRTKVARGGCRALRLLRVGRCLDLPFEDDEFDAATVGFAGRNVTDLRRFFSEMRRVVRPGGRVVHLELSKPTTPGFRTIYDAYLHYVVPRVGGALAGSRSAYTYLPNSLTPFPDPQSLAGVMREAGLEPVRWRPLAFGTVTLHIGVVR